MYYKEKLDVAICILYRTNVKEYESLTCAVISPNASNRIILTVLDNDLFSEQSDPVFNFDLTLMDLIKLKKCMLQCIIMYVHCIAALNHHQKCAFNQFPSICLFIKSGMMKSCILSHPPYFMMGIQ